MHYIILHYLGLYQAPLSSLPYVEYASSTIASDKIHASVTVLVYSIVNSS